MVWIGTAGPVPSMGGKEPDPELGHARVEPEPADAPVRHNVLSPVVTYVGSHEGCGCGFNSKLWAYQGIEEESELALLIGGMLDDERKEYLAERRSREHLHRLVSTALRDGPVTVYCCWAGDEAKPAVADKRVDAGWLLQRTAPLEEGVRYTITG